MRFFAHVIAGLRRLFDRRAFDQDVHEKVEHFVSMEEARLIRAGVAPADARRQARAIVGGPTQVREAASAGGWEFAVETLWQDTRYALRALRRNPGYTAAAIATLTIGIAGVTIVYALVSAVLLRPPAEVRAPEELVAIYTSDFSGPPFGSSSYPDFETFRDQKQLFAGAFASAPRPVGIGEGDALRNDVLELVSADYFSVLGVVPVVGRGFVADEARPGSPVAVTVISHELWQERFAGATDMVGKSIKLNGRAFTVIGVAPARYHGVLRGLAIAAWIPIPAGSLIGAPGGEGQREDRSYFVYARLAPDVSIEQATAGLATVGRNLAASYPDAWRDVTGAGRRVTVLPEAETRVPPQARGAIMGVVGLLSGTMVLVLLVCCANVAGLTLARAARRVQEMGVRLSLGAPRRRIVRQLLTESSIVALGGAAAGTGVTYLAIRAIMAYQPPILVRIALDLEVDTRVLAMAFGGAVVTGLIVGIAPALRASRAAVTGMLKGESVTLGRHRVSLQGMLVSAQVAMSMLLLVGAMLFVRSLQAASRIDTGFTTERLLLVDVEPRPDVEGPVRGNETALAMHEALSVLSGIQRVSWGTVSPMSLARQRTGISVDGYTPAQGEDMEIHFGHVGPGYMTTLGASLVAGRDIETGDREGAPRVVLVNEAFVRRFLNGRQPLGARVGNGGEDGQEVVGVMRDSRLLSLTEEARPFIYFPSLQRPGGNERREGFTLHIRTSGDPLLMRDAVRRAIARVAPAWLERNVRSMEQQMGVTLAPQRVASVVLSLFGLVAALMASVGLYGVVSLAVAARRREIGIRMALGARAGRVVRVMVRDGARLAAIGIMVGLGGGWGMSRLMSSLLIGDVASAPTTFLAAALLLGAITIVAAWLPARRAARVRPMAVLRDE